MPGMWRILARFLRELATDSGMSCWDQVEWYVWECACKKQQRSCRQWAGSWCSPCVQLVWLKLSPMAHGPQAWWWIEPRSGDPIPWNREKTWQNLGKGSGPEPNFLITKSIALYFPHYCEPEVWFYWLHEWCFSLFISPHETMRKKCKDSCLQKTLVLMSLCMSSI